MAHDTPPSRLRTRTHSTRTPGRRNLYVSVKGVEVWQAAEEFALNRGASLSSVVEDALARYLADPPKPEER